MISSLSNQKVKDIKKLAQPKYSKTFGKTLIYNDKVIREAQAQSALDLVITTNPKRYQGEKTLVVTAEVLKKIHPHGQAQDVAIVARPEAKPISTSQVLVLDQIKDPGNMGSILRSCYSFGIKDVVISPNSVDVYSHKVIVASAGSIFGLNIHIKEIAEYLRTSSLPIITTFLDEENQIKDANIPAEFNLVIGNEQVGITPEIKNLPHTNLKINTTFESLNVAVAAGISIYIMKGNNGAN